MISQYSSIDWLDFSSIGSDGERGLVVSYISHAHIGFNTGSLVQHKYIWL